MNTYVELALMRKRCESHIVSLVGAEMAPNWWHSQNVVFDLRTPEEQWMIEPKIVYKYICGSIDGYW